MSLVAFVLACCVSHAGTAILQNHRQALPSTAYYYGVLGDSIENPVYFVYLDSAAGRGSYYDPPYGSELLAMKHLTDGRIQLRVTPTEDHDGFAFSGIPAGDSIVGDIVTIIGGYHENHHITFRLIRPNPVDPGANFSSMNTDNDEGDLLGEELLVVNRGQDLFILLSVAEGQPGSVHLASNVKADGKKVTFTVPGNAPDSTFVAVIDRQTLRLSRAEPYAKSSVLTKKQDLYSLMQNALKRKNIIRAPDNINRGVHKE